MALTQFKTLNRSGNYFKVKLNDTNLKVLKEQIALKMVAQVGVLGESMHNRKGYSPRKVTENTKTGKHKVGKSESAQTNADIGLIHEKGSISKKIPRRSFIEMPLTLYLDKEVKKALPAIKRAIESLDLRKAYALLGLAAESVILQAFNSQGYGKWAPNSPYTIARKGSSKPLIDTAQLRKSINSRVVTQ